MLPNQLPDLNEPSRGVKMFDGLFALAALDKVFPKATVEVPSFEQFLEKNLYIL